jgi:hypothetical protein
MWVLALGAALLPWMPRSGIRPLAERELSRSLDALTRVPPRPGRNWLAPPVRLFRQWQKQPRPAMAPELASLIAEVPGRCGKGLCHTRSTT